MGSRASLEQKPGDKKADHKSEKKYSVNLEINGLETVENEIVFVKTNKLVDHTTLMFRNITLLKIRFSAQNTVLLNLIN